VIHSLLDAAADKVGVSSEGQQLGRFAASLPSDSFAAEIDLPGVNYNRAISLS
jgi:hypothetical protein